MSQVTLYTVGHAHAQPWWGCVHVHGGRVRSNNRLSPQCMQCATLDQPGQDEPSSG